MSKAITQYERFKRRNRCDAVCMTKNTLKKNKVRRIRLLFYCKFLKHRFYISHLSKKLGLN